MRSNFYRANIIVLFYIFLKNVLNVQVSGRVSCWLIWIKMMDSTSANVWANLFGNKITFWKIQFLVEFTLGHLQTDHINRMITTSHIKYFLDSYFGLGQFDHFNRTITLSVITLRSLIHCFYFFPTKLIIIFADILNCD